MRITWRPPPDKGDLVLIYALVFIVWAVFAILHLWLGFSRPLCLFRYFTGLPCPGCGSTRAASALMHLRIAEALKWNPLMTIAMCGVILYCAWALASSFWRWPRPHVEITPQELRRGAVLLAFMLAANWLYLIWAGV